MRERILSKREKYLFLTAGLIIITYFSFFIIAALKADFLYEKAVSLEKPSLEQGKLKYYNQVLGLISEAVKYNKANADYYGKKADYLLEAMDDNLNQELAGGEEAIENLYKKAIGLNPINFEYHLKLGWFYAGKGDGRGEEELIKAAKLYPRESRVYVYLAEYYLIKGQEDELIKAAKLYPEESQIYLSLAKYYFREGRGQEAFINLILFLHYEESKDARYKTLSEIKEVIKGSDQVSLDFEERNIKFTAWPQASEFDFKKEGFPHQKINPVVYIYTQNLADEVILYKDKIPYANFIKRRPGREDSFHNLWLGQFYPDIYLDQLKIRTSNGVAISKLEIFQAF